MTKSEWIDRLRRHIEAAGVSPACIGVEKSGAISVARNGRREVFTPTPSVLVLREQLQRIDAWQENSHA